MLPRSTGFYRCSQCPTGSYDHDSDPKQCIQCSAGFYQDETGKTGCKLCAIERSLHVVRLPVKI